MPLNDILIALDAVVEEQGVKVLSKFPNYNNLKEGLR